MVIYGHGKTDLSKQIMTFSTENWLKKAAMLSTYSQGGFNWPAQQQHWWEHDLLRHDEIIHC